METNFLPGRTFASLEDLNGQAASGRPMRMEHRVLTKARVIPAQLFEHERLYLQPAAPASSGTLSNAPARHGSVRLCGLRGQLLLGSGDAPRGREGAQYADRLKIFRHYDCLAEYPLPPDGTRQPAFQSPGRAATAASTPESPP